jgi:hypothetical protein
MVQTVRLSCQPQVPMVTGMTIAKVVTCEKIQDVNLIFHHGRLC